MWVVDKLTSHRFIRTEAANMLAWQGKLGRGFQMVHDVGWLDDLPWSGPSLRIMIGYWLRELGNLTWWQGRRARLRSRSRTPRCQTLRGRFDLSVGTECFSDHSFSLIWHSPRSPGSSWEISNIVVSGKAWIKLNTLGSSRKRRKREACSLFNTLTSCLILSSGPRLRDWSRINDDL